jgi:hypothetical protein
VQACWSSAAAPGSKTRHRVHIGAVKRKLWLTYVTTKAACKRTGELIDQGLRSYMLKVYNLMALGLVITGLAAYLRLHIRRLRRPTDRLWRRDLYQPAEVGGNACSARNGVLPELPDQ